MRLIIILLLLHFPVFSQDIIILRNGEEIKSKIYEVGNSEVSFRKSSNMDGPIYKKDKNEIFMIKYKNGSKDIFQLNTLSNSKEESINKSPSKVMSNGYYSCVVGYDYNKKIYTPKNEVLMNIKFEKNDVYFNLIRIPKSQINKDDGHRLSSQVFTDKSKFNKEFSNGKLHKGYYEISENMIKMKFPNDPDNNGRIAIIFGFINDDNSLTVSLKNTNEGLVKLDNEYVLKFRPF